MKHKTAELEGALLDAAVANAKGEAFGASYSTDWSHGGPIIERERMCLGYSAHEPQVWVAAFGGPGAAYLQHHGKGPTQLIAAMRAYVASKFGDEVELP